MQNETISPADGSGTPEKRFRLKPFLRGEYAVAPRAARLVLVIYALLLLSRLIDRAFLSREGEYLSTVLLQLLIFPSDFKGHAVIGPSPFFRDRIQITAVVLVSIQ